MSHRILDAGDAALTIEFGSIIDPALLAAVNALDAAIGRLQQAGALPGVIETMPTFRSLTVFFDPLATDRDTLLGALQPLIDAAEHGTPVDGRHWRLPVCYEGEAAPDLAEVAATLGYQMRFTPRELYRAGIAIVERAAQQAYGKAFAELDAGKRDAVLTLADQGKLTHDADVGAAFFALLLKNTREGYFADPMYGGNREMAAWKLVGFPGARADFTDWIDQQGRRYPYGPVSINGSRGQA